MNPVSFADMTLTPGIRRAVEEMGFITATDIQAQSIPLMQEGRDVIGRSQTGTGKTLAFGIPAIECIDTSSEIRTSAQVLVLCPTRELAVQACEELRKLARYTPGIRTADVYGGAPMDRQIVKLRAANLVVGTPGRVMDHMRRRTLKLEHVRMVVLDEADEMLSMGFREDIETILSETPHERQTVLFSATMPPGYTGDNAPVSEGSGNGADPPGAGNGGEYEQTYCDSSHGAKNGRSGAAAAVSCTKIVHGVLQYQENGRRGH